VEGRSLTSFGIPIFLESFRQSEVVPFEFARSLLKQQSPGSLPGLESGHRVSIHDSSGESSVKMNIKRRVTAEGEGLEP
jgi:hypothetical protein